MFLDACGDSDSKEEHMVKQNRKKKKSQNPYAKEGLGDFFKVAECTGQMLTKYPSKESEAQGKNKHGDS